MEFELRTGRKIPSIAFGTGTTYFHRNEEVAEGIIKAFDHGFRYIDTAIAYGTEEGVGKAVKTLIQEKGYKREDIYVATKVTADYFTSQMVHEAMEQSFKRLDLDYVDLGPNHLLLLKLLP